MSKFCQTNYAQPKIPQVPFRNALPSEEDQIIHKLEEIFDSPSYNCFYKRRVIDSTQFQTNQRSKFTQNDLQEIYLKQFPKAKLELCLSFEKFSSLTIKYFKIFAPTRQSLHSYDIFLELKGQINNIINEIISIQRSIQQLIEFQKYCPFMPLRNVYLQVQTILPPSAIEDISVLKTTNVINEYQTYRLKLQEYLNLYLENQKSLNSKQQFCFEIQLDQKISSQIITSKINPSQIVEYIQELDLQAKQHFPHDKIIISPQQFFEPNFYQMHSDKIKESLNKQRHQILQVVAFKKQCAQYQQYCPLRIYYDLFSE